MNFSHAFSKYGLQYQEYHQLESNKSDGFFQFDALLKKAESITEMKNSHIEPVIDPVFCDFCYINSKIELITSLKKCQ